MTADPYLSDIEKKVWDIMVESPDTRMNDTLLIFRYWSKYCDNRIASILYQLTPRGVMNLTSPETITRVRRRITNDKELFTLPKEIQDKRREARKTMIEWVIEQ